MADLSVERDRRVLAPAELERYTDAIVRACLDLREGDQLLVHGEPGHRELLVGLVEAGYRAGAGLAEIAYADPRARAARVRYARDEDLGRIPPWEVRRYRAQLSPGLANVNVTGETEPGVLDGVPPERVAADHGATARQLRALRRAFMRGRRRGTVVAWPTEPWATQVYPGDEPLEAQRRLGRDLLWFCRLGPDDPPGFEGWAAHTARLNERGRALTELDLRRLELRGPGTSLDLRIVPGSRWLGGPRENAFGQTTAPNFPTEENFTSPDANSTEGTFRCSRPLSFRGRMIEGIAGEFHRGRLVRLEASRDADRDFLAAFLDSDRGASRLGEIALVDSSSRIGQTGRVYWNTLVDENAAAHMAFGFGNDQSRLPDPNARGARGVNRSGLHLDVMIGTDELEATGTTADGRRVPLIAGGRWQL